MPASASRLQACVGLGRAFVRMQEVHAHPQRMVLLAAPGSARGVIRCGSTAGILVPMRMNSRCGIARRLPRIQSSLSSLERQRIAAGDQHVANLRRLADVLERLLQPGSRCGMISPCPTTRDRVQ